MNLAAFIAQDRNSDEYKNKIKGSQMSIEATFGRNEQIKALFEATPECVNYHDETGSTSLINAIMSRQATTIDLLMELKADVNLPTISTLFGQISGWTPLYTAAFIGDRQLIKKLLEAGASPQIAKDSLPVGESMSQHFLSVIDEVVSN